MIVWIRESTLFFVHKSYFVQALREAPTNLLSHKYTPSVLAVYRSALRLIGTIRGIYLTHKEVGVVWVVWSMVFSSCVSIPIFGDVDFHVIVMLILLGRSRWVH
jgi:hypothetical protein